MTRQNVELKARVGQLAPLAAIAAGLPAKRCGILHQVDTYFDCRHGRLKLRETAGAGAELVCYRRPDRNEARISDYSLTPVVDAPSLKQSLTVALGVIAVVDKRRDLHLWHNVRIHLDEVVGLGTFLEFEAVLDEDNDAETGHHRLRKLCGVFGVSPAAIESRSYADLLMAQRSETSIA